jgi:hypothetical protein
MVSHVIMLSVIRPSVVAPSFEAGSDKNDFREKTKQLKWKIYFTIFLDLGLGPDS